MKRSDLHPIFLITGNKTHYPKLTVMKDKVLQQGKKPASTTSTAFPSKYEIMFFFPSRKTHGKSQKSTTEEIKVTRLRFLLQGVTNNRPVCDVFLGLTKKNQNRNQQRSFSSLKLSKTRFSPEM